MPTPEEVKSVLDTVLVPGVMRSLVKMNLVKDVSVSDGKVDGTAGNGRVSQNWKRRRDGNLAFLR